MPQIKESATQTFEESMTFDNYVDMLKKLVAENKTTGENQSEKYVNYTRQNLQRKRRAAKTMKITPEQTAFIQNLEGSWKWLVITEGWCGDAGPTVPVMQKLADLNDNIELRITLRDEHPDLMDQFLTNGGRSIPVLVIMDGDTGVVKAKWGPRPQPLQKLRKEMVDAGTDIEEINIAIQKWYALDKGRTVIEEVLALF
ncbi:MAG: thioredoxin family protein [Bacteroidetes bacterium]|nr:thioredoxin family protein [Bacteroidota bacterium]